MLSLAGFATSVTGFVPVVSFACPTEELDCVPFRNVCMGAFVCIDTFPDRLVVVAAKLYPGTAVVYVFVGKDPVLAVGVKLVFASVEFGKRDAKSDCDIPWLVEI